MPSARGCGERDAEVGDQRVPALEQDVLGLDVAMDHAGGVRVAERVGDFARDPHGFVDRQLLLARQPVAQGLALARTASRRKRVAVHAPRIEERQDVRMLQIRGGLDLGEEPLGADHGGELGPQDLERDLAIVSEVVREVDGGHAALAQLALDPVAICEAGGEPLLIRHVSST